MILRLVDENYKLFLVFVLILNVLHLPNVFLIM